MKIFYYHYNKPASKKLGKPILTIHWNDKCNLVEKIICNVPTWSHNRKHQPHCVIKGKANDIQFNNNVAIIV